MKKFSNNLLFVIFTFFFCDGALAASSACAYGYTGISGVNYKTEYHWGSWDETDYFLATVIYDHPNPYVRLTGTIVGVGSGTYTAPFHYVGWPNSGKQHYPNPPNGSATVTGKVEIGYDSGILFGDWFTAEYGGAPCNNSYVINNTPPVSVTITPTPPVAENTTVAIAWASNNASSCTYNNGIPLPNTNGSANVVATPANAITYTVTCLGPLGENNYGPVGTPGSASATLTLLCAAQFIIDEYSNPAHPASPIPTCANFVQHPPTYQFSPSFNWSEYNGNWAGGNQHPYWGMIKPALVAGLEATRASYGRPLIITSGYRNPAGNAAQPGSAQNSFHVHGRAVDLKSLQSQYPWTEAEFNLVKNAAATTSPTESFNWNTYTDHHYHVAW